MRVEIKLLPEVAEPYAIIYAKELTDEIQQVLLSIEQPKEKLFTVKQEDRLFIIDVKDIQMVRTEGGQVYVYNDAAQKFASAKRLYEVERLLGRDFIRISKGAIVNLMKIDHVDTNIFGSLDVIMKNGCVEGISRRYTQAFKSRIGI